MKRNASALSPAPRKVVGNEWQVLGVSWIGVRFWRARVRVVRRRKERRVVVSGGCIAVLVRGVDDGKNGVAEVTFDGEKRILEVIAGVRSL